MSVIDGMLIVIFGACFMSSVAKSSFNCELYGGICCTKQLYAKRILGVVNCKKSALIGALIRTHLLPM